MANSFPDYDYQGTPKQIVREHLIHDLMVMAGLFVFVFGSLLAGRQILEERYDRALAGSFTDAALDRAGYQVADSWAGVFQDILFEMGLNGDADLVAGLWYDFLGTSEPQVQPETQLAAAVAQAPIQTNGVVLGSSTDVDSGEPLQDFNTVPKTPDSTPVSVSTVRDATSVPYERIGQVEPLKPSLVEAFSGLETAYTQPTATQIAYQTNAPEVSRVEFYLNDSLVTSDTQAPYYLGGDESGQPRGYDLSNLKQPQRLEVKVYTRQSETEPAYQVSTNLEVGP